MNVRQQSVPPHPSERLDAVGAAASTICAIHCALMPLVVSPLPLIGLGFLAHGAMEWALIGLAALLGVTSLCLGYREHRSRRALAVLGIGLTLLALGRILETRGAGWYGVPILVLGGLVLAVAHLINRHLCRTCRACEARAAQRSASR